MSQIDRTAIVSDQARVGQNVVVGPFCVIERGSEIGDGCQLGARVIIKTGVRMGPGNQVFEGAILGGVPQHLRSHERPGGLEIGANNLIRENVTIHRGLKEGTATTLGNRNLLMVNAHVAHDCHIGNETIIANNAMLAGHVEVGDRAYLSGAAGVHQFCRIGRLAMVGGQAHLSQDVPPFFMIDGATTKAVGLNRVGLKRAGFTERQMEQLKAAYQLIYRSGLAWKEVLQRLMTEFESGPAAELHSFLAATQRGIVQDRRGPRMAAVKITQVELDEAAQRKAG